jgi:Fe-S cluster assembly ATPase SufC
MTHSTTTETPKVILNEFVLDIARRTHGLKATGPMLILFGPEGCGKSRLVQALAGESKSTVTSVKAIHGNENFNGFTFVEITDFTSLTPTDIEKLKQLITNPKHDKITFIGTSITINPKLAKSVQQFAYAEVNQTDVDIIKLKYERKFTESVNELRAKGELPPE